MYNFVLFPQTDATLLKNGAKFIVIKVKLEIFEWVQNLPHMLIQGDIVLKLEEIGLEIRNRVLCHPTLSFNWAGLEIKRHEERFFCLLFKTIGYITWVVRESRRDRWSNNNWNSMLRSKFLIEWVLKLN